VLAISFSQTFTAMAVMLCFYGVGIGAYFVIIPTVLAQMHGIVKLNSSYSFVRFAMGFINFVSPQVSGESLLEWNIAIFLHHVKYSAIVEHNKLLYLFK
jgi:hypothetical protein